MVVSGVIAARLLGPEDRGYLALLVLVPLIVAKVGGLGIPLAVTYYVARERDATAGIWAALRPVVVFQCGLLAGVHLLVLWALLSDEPRYVTDAALVTALLVPAVLAQDYGLALLQARGRFTAFNVLRLTPIVIYAAGVTVLLVMDLDGLSEVAAVWAGANVVLGVLTTVVALSGIGPANDGAPVPRVREMVAFGAKGLLGANSAIEYYRVDQAVVGLFLTPTTLGLYSVGLAFTNLPRSIANSLGVVAYPHLAEQTEPVEARRRLWRFFAVTVGACVVVVGALELTAGWLVPFFFGEAFADSVPIVRIVLLSALLIAARRILSDGARGLGQPGLGTVAEAVSVITLIPAVAVFLPLWGVEGVAFALVVAGLVSLPVMFIGLARTRPAATPRRALGSQPRIPGLARAGSALTLLALVLIADALAVVAVFVSPLAGIGVAVALCLALAAIALRHRLGADARVPAAAAAPDEVLANEPDGLGGARALYYVGVLLVGFLVLRAGAGLNASDLFFFGALGLTILTLIARRQAAPVFVGPMLFLGVALFAAGGLLSSLGTEAWVESLTVVARVIYITLVWFWLGAVLLTNPSHLRVAIGCWVASAALGGAGAIVQTLFGDVIPGGEVHYGRVSGFVYQVNDLGGLCAVAAIPAAMLVARAETLAGRLASTAGLLLIVAGLLLSSSVTAMVAVAGAGAVWIVVTDRRARVLVPVVAGVLLLSTFAAGNNRYWESPLERLETSTAQSGTDEATFAMRVDSYEAAWETIDSSPLLGVGLTRVGADTSTGLAVHNLFLAVWYQAGLIALVGMLFIVAYALVTGWRALVEARGSEERAVARALFAAMLAFLVFAQAQPTLFQRYGWMSVALLVALRGQQLRAATAASVRESRAGSPAHGLVAPAT